MLQFERIVLAWPPLKLFRLSGNSYSLSKPCLIYLVLLQAVELWLVDKAVLPIENSVGGSIHRNYDLLLRHRLHIAGEVQLQVNHCLLGLPGTRKQDLKRILSHPQVRCTRPLRFGVYFQVPILCNLFEINDLIDLVLDIRSILWNIFGFTRLTALVFSQFMAKSVE